MFKRLVTLFRPKTPSPIVRKTDLMIQIISDSINEEFKTVDEKKEIVAGVLARTLPHLHLKCRPYTHIKK